ncbi:hypothetical protein ACH4TV_37645 [Streptomyces sp. NPDC020898]|uniref:hypothetical protein n=1 Tax=Streptomyces sp. NPDC020898 TaxID=3365101 RepID=UPI00379A6A05
MRIRATVAAVLGALVLPAVGVPAAVAADPAVPYTLDASFSGIKVNNGKAIVVGVTGKVTVPLSYTLTHAADVDIAAEDFLTDIELYRGATYATSAYGLYGVDYAHCKAVSTTRADCTQSIVITPAQDLLNEDAGKWSAYVYAHALNGQDMGDDDYDVTKVGSLEKEGIAAPSLLRHSKLSVNAAPEPVVKGKVITVTGKLTRANWGATNYTGYATQPVQLQFRKNGTSAYTVVRTIKTTAQGDLKTTVTATADGFFRYVFAGTATTAALGSAPDFIDVK